MSEGETQPIRICMTGSCDGFDKLHEALESHAELELIGASEHIAAAAGSLAGGHLDIVLHATRGVALPTNELVAIRELTRAPIVLVASGAASDLLDDALDADVADVLLLPQLTENVVFVIRKACHAGRRTQVAAGPPGRVTTVFSPKGGTGKTVISVNLAAELSRSLGKRTLLVDLDLQFGDAAIMLGLEPEKTLFDLVVAPGELDADKLAGYAAKHPTGLDVLPAPLRPEDAELITESKVGQLLEVARSAYELIVVDTSPFFHGPMLSTLDRTDELLLVTCLDIPTLKNVRLGMQTLELLSFPPQRVRVILNRSNERVGLKPRQVEEALETKIAHEIPFDRAVPLSVNRGAPVSTNDPSCDFARAIRSLAQALCAEKTTGRRRLRAVAA